MAPTTRSMSVDVSSSSEDGQGSPPFNAGLQLDDDVLNLCFSTMPTADLARARLVSRKFESVASQENLWEGRLAGLEKTMPLPQEENWTTDHLATWGRRFPQATVAQLVKLMRQDEDFKDPRLSPQRGSSNTLSLLPAVASSTISANSTWASLSSVAKYGALRAYDQRVIARLKAFRKSTNWTTHDRRLLTSKADELQRYDEGWERVAFEAGEDESDYGESLYEYLLDAQERITPETCATAIAVVAGHDFYKRRKPRRCFRLLLVGGPAFCELYMSDFRLAMQISKLI
jgi:hypothetical protein